jgi:hypothetical protein
LLAIEAASAVDAGFSKFVDVAEAAGLNKVMFYGEGTKATYLTEIMGGGCAFFDFDNDGWMDIFIVGGRRLESVPAGASNRLYKNNRDGTFSDVTAQAGLTDAGWAVGVCVGDYNDDGFEDLFLTYFGQNRLYRNNGNGTFTDVTQLAGLGSVRLRLHLCGLQPRRLARPVCLELCRCRSREDAHALARAAQLQLPGRSSQLRSERPALAHPPSLSEQRKWHFHRCFKRVRGGSDARLLRLDCGSL